MLRPSLYQPAARKIYRIMAHRLRTTLPDARIEHIGASSVPGLWSKGDLDIYVGVPRETFARATQALEQLGFYPKHGSLRTEELCYFVVEGFRLDVGLQLVALGSRFEFFLTFRNRLRRSLRLRAAYNRLKRAARVLDSHAYRQIKTSFIQAVLRGQPRQAFRHTASGTSSASMSSNCRRCSSGRRA